MIRVLIADHQQSRRAGLRALLDDARGVQVVAEAGSGMEAAALAHRADVVVLQAGLGDVTPGVGATALITARAGAPSVIVLAPDLEADGVGDALAAGALGCLVDGAGLENLEQVVRAAARGERVPHDGAPQRGATSEAQRSALTNGRPALSQREVEVLAAVATGASNRQAAQMLFVSESTVKSHLAHAFGKLGVTSRGAAVAEARRQGIIA